MMIWKMGAVRMDNANTETKLTLGSLFDGSGGFPLAGLLAGVRPVWV